MENNKNFSEAKERTSNKRCRLCKEPLPQIAIYRLNEIALRQGFCSWGCLVGGMNEISIVALIKREREKDK